MRFYPDTNSDNHSARLDMVLLDTHSYTITGRVYIPSSGGLDAVGVIAETTLSTITAIDTWTSFTHSYTNSSGSDKGFFLRCKEGGTHMFAGANDPDTFHFFLKDIIITQTTIPSPLVKGASQTDGTLITDGWMPFSNAVLKAGGYIQLGSYFYMVVQDASADSTGTANLEIWPCPCAAPQRGTIPSPSPAPNPFGGYPPPPAGPSIGPKCMLFQSQPKKLCK